ncbi:hypothetical protein H5410_002553 [Solanum commersonii]|uniref:Uncharacterized protein n=1 Tax=Solanum commersonii TaxID=4109 RepID=A0A9J6B2G6_SOLCO|nr:hypothetical protein H5410_002553 [Solanum commersonii]
MCSLATHFVVSVVSFNRDNVMLVPMGIPDAKPSSGVAGPKLFCHPHRVRLHQRVLLQEQTEVQTICMLYQVSRIRRARHILPLVFLKYLASSPDVSTRFDVFLEQLLEPFSVSTRVGESILDGRLYRGCNFSIYHRKSWRT